MSCGQCVAICKEDALEHSNFKENDIYAYDKKKLPTSEDVLLLLKARRSQRFFKDKQVGKKEIETIIEGARYAPSSENTQSTQYIVIQDKVVQQQILEMTVLFFKKIVKLLKNPIIKNLYLLFNRVEAEDTINLIPKFERFINAFYESEDRVLFNSPCLIFFHGDKRLSFTDVNAGLALQNATLTADSLGLGSFYVGYVMAAAMRDKSFSKLLSLPDHHKFYGGIALGYPKYRFNKYMEKNSPQVKWR